MGVGMYNIYRIHRNWSMGIEQDHWLGLGYYQLRLVGWDWSRWNPDFGSTSSLPSKMENGSKPICGSHDYLCGSAGWIVPDYPHGTSMVGILGTSPSKPVRIPMD